LNVSRTQHKLANLQKKLKTAHAELIISNNEHKNLMNEVKERDKQMDLFMIKMLSNVPPNENIEKIYKLVKREEQLKKTQR
ncbi:unnamed protein product, partial [Hymenolepis diminuta]